MSITEVFRRASDTEIKKHSLMFCSACLLVWLLIESYGLDLSPGFF
jgi:hypothetical protein